MHYSWVNRLYSANRASFDVMKCRHINIVFRVELQVSDYFLYLCILVHHMIWEIWIEFPQVVILPLTPSWSIQAAARYLYHVSSSLLFYLPYACYYRYLTKVHDGQPFYLSEWKTALDTPPTIKWYWVEKFGILSEYRYSESITNFSTPYHTQFLWIALIHQMQ